jgi:hypothetical protein
MQKEWGKFSSENLNGREYLEDIDGRMILKWIKRNRV